MKSANSISVLIFIFFAFQGYGAIKREPYLLKKTLSNNILLKDKTDSFLENGIRYYAYSPGIYAPIGVMMGIYSIKGYGIYFSARINRYILKKSGQYYFDGTSINDHSLNWQYNNEKIYSRYEANAGFMGKIIEKKEHFIFSFYAGMGVLRPRYMYSFKQISRNGITEQRWVLYKEISKISVNTEGGIIFLLNESINFHLGLSAITKKHERMITFGIGISRAKN